MSDAYYVFEFSNSTWLFQDLTVGQFVYVIRKRIKLAPEKAIFIFVDEVLPPTAALMSAIYEEHKYASHFFYYSFCDSCIFCIKG